jgi:hypothetical protein
VERKAEQERHHNMIKLMDVLSEAEDKGCPLPTQNIDLNLKNRNKAFKKYNYGPADPRHDLAVKVTELDYGNLKDSDFKSKEELEESPNISYWNKLMDIYNTEDIFAILKQRCGNCAAFNISDKMRDCIKKGIGDEAPVEPIIKVGEIGYCRFLKFKCAAARACQAWVSGGPITES